MDTTNFFVKSRTSSSFDDLDQGKIGSHPYFNSKNFLFRDRASSSFDELDSEKLEAKSPAEEKAKFLSNGISRTSCVKGAGIKQDVGHKRERNLSPHRNANVNFIIHTSSNKINQRYDDTERRFVTDNYFFNHSSKKNCSSVKNSTDNSRVKQTNGQHAVSVHHNLKNTLLHDPICRPPNSLTSSPCTSFDSSSSAYSSLGACDMGSLQTAPTKAELVNSWQHLNKNTSTPKPVGDIRNNKFNAQPPKLPNCGELQAVEKIITRVLITEKSDTSVTIRNTINAQKSLEYSKTSQDSAKTDIRSTTSRETTGYKHKNVDKTIASESRIRSSSVDNPVKQNNSSKLTVQKGTEPKVSDKYANRDKVSIGKDRKTLRRIVHFDDEEIDGRRSLDRLDSLPNQRVEVRVNENDDLTYVNIDELGTKKTFSGVLHRSFRSGRSLSRSLGKSLRRSEHFKRPALSQQKSNTETKDKASKSQNCTQQTKQESKSSLSKRQRSSSESRARSKTRRQESSRSRSKSPASAPPPKPKNSLRASIKRSLSKSKKRANSVAKDFRLDSPSQQKDPVSLTEVTNNDNNNNKRINARRNSSGKEKKENRKHEKEESHYDFPKGFGKRRTQPKQTQTTVGFEKSKTDTASQTSLGRKASLIATDNKRVHDTKSSKSMNGNDFNKTAETESSNHINFPKVANDVEPNKNGIRGRSETGQVKMDHQKLKETGGASKSKGYDDEILKCESSGATEDGTVSGHHLRESSGLSSTSEDDRKVSTKF